MSKENEIQKLAEEIRSLLNKLEIDFWEAFVAPGEDWYQDKNRNTHYNYEIEDKKVWVYQGTKMLYYKICLFLELKGLPLFYQMFTLKFQQIIIDENKTMKAHGGLYNDSEPSLYIHTDFRDFLSAFIEFDSAFFKKLKTNKLKLILENTNSILSRTNTEITNEASIYAPIKWVTEIIYPSCKSLTKARFIKKFTTYHPDILIPEISTAVEYKYIKKGQNIEKYLDQIKTDADNYTGDLEFKFFYAVVYFEDKSEINQGAFKYAVSEKKFPENWEVIAV